MAKKFCAGCQNNLPLSDFTSRKTGERTGQPVSKCKKCRVLVNNQYKVKEGSLYERVGWPSKIRTAYGVEPEDYYRMLSEQGGWLRNLRIKNSGI